jgi:hypothetical protein
MYEVERVFPRHVQGTCLAGESPLGRPRVAYTLHLYNYLLRFYLIMPPPLKRVVPNPLYA